MIGEAAVATADRVDQLTDSQKRCLRLVLAHMTSKQIARELQLSPHTVDAHLKAALKTLSAANRTEAALMLAAAEADSTCQPLAYQSLAMVNTRQSMVFPGHGISPADDIDYTRLAQTEGEHKENIVHDAFADAGFLKEFQEQSFAKASPKKEGLQTKRNKLPKSYRIVAILIISLSSILLFAAVVSAMQSLSSLYN